MRRLTLAILAVVALGLVAPVATVTAQTFVTVSDVTVEPSSPMPGELTTIETTIENPQNAQGGSTVEITDVAIRERGSSNELLRVENVDTISPGSSTIVPLQLSFDERGRHDLTLRVWGRDRGTSNSFSVKQPFTVTVGGQHPGIDVRTEESVAGVKQSGTVKVANGLDTAVSNAKVTVEGDDAVTVTNGRSVVAKLESGASTSTNFSYRASEPGEHTITTTLTYLTSAGTERTVTENATIVVDELRENVVLDASAITSGDSPAIRVDVLNRGNTAIESVSLAGSSANASVRQALIGEVPAGESKTARLNVSMDEPVASVTVDATYDVGSRENRTSTSVDVRTAPGSIDLTGVELTRERGAIRIAGSASNVGLTDVDSVQVGVLSTDGVSPASPNKEYFVGTVPSSDFVSFDVYATTSQNATSIPVQVSYLVDGERKRQVFRYEAPTQPDFDQDERRSNQSGGSGLLLPLGIGLLALLVVGGIVAYYYVGGSDDEL